MKRNQFQANLFSNRKLKNNYIIANIVYNSQNKQKYLNQLLLVRLHRKHVTLLRMGIIGI